MLEQSRFHVLADYRGTFGVQSGYIHLGVALRGSAQVDVQREERIVLSMLVCPSQCKGFSHRELLANTSGLAEQWLSVWAQGIMISILVNFVRSYSPK